MEGRSSRARSSVCGGKRICKRRRPKSQFLNLPEDIQCKILSELPLKEATRTSILSTQWGSVRSVHPRLRFDGATMCGGRGRTAAGSKQYLQEFVRNVNAVLQRHNGTFVEDFEVKFEYDSELAGHLDSWIRFVAASQTKNLVFDLVPDEFRGRRDRYLLPMELLDGGSTSRRLLCIQLSFVSIKLPPGFNGFPNLRKLDLHLIRVTAKDLQDVLSSCSNLEWLSLVRCHLNDELKVDHPLSCLLHLHVTYCEVTKIQFNATKLKTFVYRGEWRPIDLSQSSELKDVHLYLDDDFITLEHALTTFPTALPTVQSLTLKAVAPLKMPGLLLNPCKFSQLKYLHLDLMIIHEDADNVLSLASYLRAAPLIEKLELHFGSFALPHYRCDPIRSLPRCRYNYLKNINVMGFMGSRGQLEFLLHAVENAPTLEVLTLDLACRFNVDHQGRTYFTERVREIGIKYLDERVLPTTKLCVL
ncbi:unnamed protein product [Alopecurus aequalis]